MNKPGTYHRRHDAGGSALIVTVLALGFLFLLTMGGCATPSPSPTPTPTRTPQPTWTPTPTQTPSPTPTPTPAFPVRVGCSELVPQGACERLAAQVDQDPVHFIWSDADDAEVALMTSSDIGASPVGLWTYAVAAPFFTVEDDVTTTDLQAAWQGAPTGALALHPLLATTDTVESLITLWGPPGEDGVRMVAAEALLAEAEAVDGWALLPFHELHPEWKVLRVDDLSLLGKGKDLSGYPLQLPLYVRNRRGAEIATLLSLEPDSYANRDELQMTLVVMTGVTAMTRATAQLMDVRGITYPAQDILPWFEDADFVHISNEVSFTPNCVAEASGTMSFCSHESYIALLEEIGTNIVELTGNHLEDKGAQWVDYSLDMYAERGWRWYGGGRNALEGSRPITLTHNGNQIAFIGCNHVGPYADDASGGAAPCNYPAMQQTIAALDQSGYQTIATVQHYEAYDPAAGTYFYEPTLQQMADFRGLAEAGAAMVQGSQAHQPQTMEFYGGAFVHYGLGNFFFDQMWSDGTRQQFVDRLTFSEGRLLSVDLRTAILEEYGRPRPMTVGDPDPAADRARFLEMIFALSPQP
ncbi:MAG: CapA family protein [Anaerolineae bacterium]|nr:CapA family protein [Anaerolineae bacterium]